MFQDVDELVETFTELLGNMCLHDIWKPHPKLRRTYYLNENNHCNIVVAHSRWIVHLSEDKEVTKPTLNFYFDPSAALLYLLVSYDM